MNRKKVPWKEYISITEENRVRLDKLEMYQLAIFVRILLTADEYGVATEEDALGGYAVAPEEIELALARLEADGFIEKDSDKIAVIDWEQYQL